MLEIIILTIVVFVEIILGSLALITDPKSNANRFFAMMSWAMALWGISLYLFHQPIPTALLWGKIVFAVTFFTGFFILNFSIEFPSKTGIPLRIYKLLIIFRKFYFAVILCLSIISLSTNLIIKDVQLIDVSNNFIPGSLYFIYIVHWIFALLASFLILGIKFKILSGIEKLQVRFLFLGFFISGIIAIFTNILWPLISDGNELSRYGPLSMIFLLGFTAYAIRKHHLMNIKVIATEFLVFTISLVSLIQIFFSATRNEIIIKSIFFLGILIIGILLVRSVIQEVRRREEMQKLSEELELANVKLKSLDEAKSEFISIASHQLRTPLSFIKGTVSMALEGVWGKMTEAQENELNKIYVSNERLIKLIDDLLDISRIESRRMQFTFEAVDLVAMVEETTQQFMNKAKEKKLFLVFKKPDKPLSKVKADSLKLRQVVMNMIDNAMKYTDEGGITVEVADGVDKLKFSVTDTGVGVSEEQQKKLFQKFSRAKNVAKDHTEGMGLGLYLAAQLIQSHNGKIWVESDGEGKGSKFCFYIPKAK